MTAAATGVGDSTGRVTSLDAAEAGSDFVSKTRVHTGHRVIAREGVHADAATHRALVLAVPHFLQLLVGAAFHPFLDGPTHAEDDAEISEPTPPRTVNERAG